MLPGVHMVVYSFLYNIGNIWGLMPYGMRQVIGQLLKADFGMIFSIS